MTNNYTDLVIIGGGATGSSIAYEASKRGLSSVLLDSGDIAGATSCRSTKLLHGGLRYLELAFKTFDLAQIDLVKEALSERNYWLKQVPFLSNKLELILPSSNCFNHLYNSIGLKIYDQLSGKENIGKSRDLSTKQIKKALPLLKETKSGGVLYSDGQFNDARLSLLLALSAEREGALIRTYCKVVGFEKMQDGKIKSVISEDLNGKQERWTTKVVINATGIFSDSIRHMVDSSIDDLILASRGIHLVLNQNLCPEGKGLLIPSTDDGRILFALPFYGKTLIGTTDTPCSPEMSQRASIQEQDYLIKHLKRWFPSLTNPQIKSCWAGARPLVKSNSNFKDTSSSRLIREHLIETLPCGLISAMGGKWTTCRPIALDTLNAVERFIEKPLLKPKQMPILGSNENSEKTIALLKEQSHVLRNYLPKSSLIDKQIVHLQSQYGLNAPKVIANSQESDREPLSDIIPLCKAEIIESIINEHAKNPTDILSRRTRLAMVDIEEAERLVSLVQEQLSLMKLPTKSLNIEQ